MPLPIAAAGVAGLMAFLWASFSRLIFSKGGQWVIAIFAYLGLTLVAQEVVMDPMTDYMADAFSGLPQIIAQWLGVLNVDVYASLVLSGYTLGAMRRVFMRRVAA